MKVNLSNFNKFDGFSSQKRAVSSEASRRQNEQVHYKKSAPNVMQSTHLINEDKSKNTDMMRPAESISFGGSVSSNAAKAASNLAQTKEKLGLTDKLVRNKTFHKILKKSDENEAVIKALIALGLAGVLKPICVLAMPGAKEEDKQFTATKNCLSAVIGYLLSCAVFNPLSRGVNEFLDNPEKYIKDKDNWLIKKFQEDAEEAAKDKHFEKIVLTPELIKKGKEEAKKAKVPFYYTDMKTGVKTVYKNAPGLIVAPLKAALTIALMPIILKLVFGESKGKKKAEKQEQLTPQMDILNNSALTKINLNSNTDKIFDNFTKGGMQK